MARAWPEYIRTLYLRKPGPRKPPSSQAKAKIAPLRVRGVRGVTTNYLYDPAANITPFIPLTLRGMLKERALIFRGNRKVLPKFPLLRLRSFPPLKWKRIPPLKIRGVGGVMTKYP